MPNNISIDSQLIDEFRNRVNKHAIFRQKFSNVNGRNKWNIICSAMDWITITSEGLPNIYLAEGVFGVNANNALNLMQYIISIDVMVESVDQLFRVLDNGKVNPLSKDKTIFNHNKISDDEYFKHLRASFSTHPVNLKSLDGVKNEGEPWERFYASWVSAGGLNINDVSDYYDYYVLLYSNDPSKDLKTLQLGLKIDQINEYAVSRYELLHLLIDKVDDIINNHIDKYKNSTIQSVENNLEQLNILQVENENRFGKNQGYSGTISYLQCLINLDIDKYEVDEFFLNIFKEYKLNLTKSIDKIKNGLEMMKERECYIKYYWRGYEFQKIYDYINNGDKLIHTIGFEYLEGLVRHKKLPEIILNTNDLLFVRLILDSYLYHLAVTRGMDSIPLNEIVPIVYPK